jgi:hypothetical protein
MDLPAKDVVQGRFFAVADRPPDNVYVMCVQPRERMAGLCQNINTLTHYTIDANRLVRLIRKDEEDQREFHVICSPEILAKADFS